MRCSPLSYLQQTVDFLFQMIVYPVGILFGQDIGNPLKQYCKRCGRTQNVDWHVDETGWAQLPAEWFYTCLCLECYSFLVKDGPISLDRFEYLDIGEDDSID